MLNRLPDAFGKIHRHGPPEIDPVAMAITSLPPHALIPLRSRKVPLVFRIESGCVALFTDLPDGRRQILDVLGPGSVISGDLLDAGHGKAITLTYCHLERIAAADQPRIVDAAARQMLLRAQAHSLLLGRKTAPERVASALLDLADHFSRPKRTASNRRITIILHLTRAELADWLGLTPETVSRCLSNFKRSRLISFDQPERIIIRELAALRALAEGSKGEPSA